MDIETLVKKIDELESQLSSLKKAVASQNSRMIEIDDRASGFVEKTREQKNEISRLNSLISGLGQFDAAITKIRVDFNKQLEEVEKRNQLNIQMSEKVIHDEIRSINQILDNLQRDQSREIDHKMKALIDENSRIIQKFNDINNQVDEKIISSEDFKSCINLIEMGLRQDKKILDNLTSEFETYKKRLEEIRLKSDIIQEGIRANESRVNEIVATENERKQAFINFMEQQTLVKNDRDRIWKEWEELFNDSVNQTFKLIPELQNQQMEMKKTKEVFEEVIKGLERRSNEITEMYRLMDEKFRKEWATFKSDFEKKWTGVSLLQEEKQGSLSGQFEKINERVQNLEDHTRDLQEALVLMSKEIQKGMQSLMMMVNGWLDAFNQIK